MNQGYIGLYREMMKWEWYQDAKTKAVFIHLCLLACHEKDGGKWQGQHIKRGQLITGRKRLAKDLGLSEQTIRTSISRLTSTNEITIESTTKNSVITIVNYETYNPLNEKRTSQPTKTATEHQPKPNQSLTTLKNVENEKELNTTTNALSSPRKKPRKKALPVRDNPPSKDDLWDYCHDQGFHSNNLDLDKFWNYYVTDQDGQWKDKNGQDVMNWKHKLRTWHENGKKNATNNNYVQDQGRSQELNSAGQPKYGERFYGHRQDAEEIAHGYKGGNAKGEIVWITIENPEGVPFDPAIHKELPKP